MLVRRAKQNVKFSTSEEFFEIRGSEQARPLAAPQSCPKRLYLVIIYSTNKHPYSALFLAPSRSGLLRTYTPGNDKQNSTVRGMVLNS